MIIVFHFIILISKYFARTLSKSSSDNRDSKCHEIENEENSPEFHQERMGSGGSYENGQLRFCPPVYMQRYEVVFSILQQSPWNEIVKKVVDFGCAELSFFLYLKQISRAEEILEIDIDDIAIERGLTKAAPFNSDYLFCKRSKPLHVQILNGSIADYDDCLSGTDAVVAIEVIEHLTQDVLDKMPYNIFHMIRPKIAIFTTPNADFNILFPNFNGFRHPDHKFEWNRREFHKWTQIITKEYPNYSVKFYGIGLGPMGSENLGCCTQMAVFTRNDGFEDDSSDLKPKGIKNYRLIRKYEYPFYVDTRTDEEKILSEVLYRIKFTINETNYYNEEDCSITIPLRDLIEYVSDLCDSEEKLMKILIDRGFYVREVEDGYAFIQYELTDPSYRDDDEEQEEEESSLEYNMARVISDGDFHSENWDSPTGDGDSNSRSELDNRNYQTVLSNDSSSRKISKYTILSRFRKKKKIRWNFLRNQTKNLVRLSDSMIDLNGSFENLNDLEEGNLIRSFSDSDIYIVETENVL